MLTPPAVLPPPGVELQDNGKAIIQCSNPSFEQLQWATVRNKQVGRGASGLPAHLEVNAGGEHVKICWEALWAALVRAGGIHLVSEGTSCSLLLASMLLISPSACCCCLAGAVLLPCPASSHPDEQCCTLLFVQVLARKVALPGVVQDLLGADEACSSKVLRGVEDRIRTWLLHMYGPSEAEELGKLSSAKLEGGWLLRGAWWIRRGAWWAEGGLGDCSGVVGEDLPARPPACLPARDPHSTPTVEPHSLLPPPALQRLSLLLWMPVSLFTRAARSRWPTLPWRLACRTALCCSLQC